MHVPLNIFPFKLENIPNTTKMVITIFISFDNLRLVVLNLVLLNSNFLLTQTEKEKSVSATIYFEHKYSPVV